MDDAENTSGHSGTRRSSQWIMTALPLTVGLLLLRRRGTDGLRWYRVVYRLAYRLGLAVWQRATPPADLVALVEGPSALTPGRALDLDCGTGTDTLYLATHGWEVTAVDMVPQALATARRRATAAGMTPRFIQGDVTSVTQAAAPGATLLLYGFTRPPKAAPMHAGISTDEVRRSFTPAGWNLVTADRASAEALGVGVSRADDRFELWCYQLRRPC